MAYKRKTEDEYEVQVCYVPEYGYEMVTVEETWKDARAQAKCYRENQEYHVRIVKKRVKLTNGDVI